MSRFKPSLAAGWWLKLYLQICEYAPLRGDHWTIILLIHNLLKCDPKLAVERQARTYRHMFYAYIIFAMTSSVTAGCSSSSHRWSLPYFTLCERKKDRKVWFYDIPQFSLKRLNNEWNNVPPQSPSALHLYGCGVRQGGGAQDQARPSRQVPRSLFECRRHAFSLLGLWEKGLESS